MCTYIGLPDNGVIVMKIFRRAHDYVLCSKFSASFACKQATNKLDMGDSMQPV
jgi:hypothetical protein